MNRPYQYKPYERPVFPGAAGRPDHPVRRKVAYFIIGVLLGLVSGLQNGLLVAALPQVQGSLGLTPVEGGLVTAAYYMTYCWMSMLLFKVRQQFGINRFTHFSILVLLALNTLQLFVSSLEIELAARAASGFASNAMMVLGMYYLMQGLPRQQAMLGVVGGMGVAQVALPLARAIAPLVLVNDQVSHLYLLQFGLTLVVAGAVFLLPLPPGDTAPAFVPMDFLSFPLYAIGIASLCLVLVMGRVQSWDMSWLGVGLAVAIVGVGTSLFLEAHRRRPMFMVRWMTSREIVIFALSGVVVRLLVSEQSVTAGGLLGLLGMGSDQLVTLYALNTLGAALGLLVAIWRLDLTDVRRPVLVALFLVAASAFFDMHASPVTRPAQMYVSQFVLSFAAVYFLVPLMLDGQVRALSHAPSFIISFAAVFNLSQSVGGLAGTALLARVHDVRAKDQLMTLGAQASTSDPLVAARIQEYAAALAPSITDPVLRQTEATARLAQVLARDASINAYNDVFLLVGIAAIVSMLILGVIWLRDRRTGSVSLQKPAATIVARMAASGQAAPPR